MGKKFIDYFCIIIGVILAVGGIYIIKTIGDLEGVLKSVPYVCIGIGCGMFGNGIGNKINNKIIYKDPNIKRQIDIEKSDERNIAIQNMSKAKAYDMMIYVLGAVILSLALMNVDVFIIIMLVLAYLFIIGYGIYFRFKFDKEM